MLKTKDCGTLSRGERLLNAPHIHSDSVKLCSPESIAWLTSSCNLCEIFLCLKKLKQNAMYDAIAVVPKMVGFFWNGNNSGVSNANENSSFVTN